MRKLCGRSNEGISQCLLNLSSQAEVRGHPGGWGRRLECGKYVWGRGEPGKGTAEGR